MSNAPPYEPPVLPSKTQSVKLGAEPEMYPAPPPKVQRFPLK